MRFSLNGDPAEIAAFLRALRSGERLPPIAGGAPTPGQAVSLVDSAGNQAAGAASNFQYGLNVQTEGQKVSYSAGNPTIALAATASDVFTIFGSAVHTVRVTRVAVSGIASTAATTTVLLVKRSTVNTGGTSSAPVIVPHDSNNVVPTATVLVYTANPTTGNSVGNVRAQYLLFALTGAGSGVPIIWDFTTRNSQGIVLRGVAQGLCVNLNGVTVTGGVVSVDVEWTEE